jgi:hypothetical protein
MIKIIYSLLKEMLLASVAKVHFRAVGERLMTRLVVYGLKRLEAMSSNSVTSGLVSDILDSLEGKGLRALVVDK